MIVTTLGQEAQVDYGAGPMVCDPYHETQQLACITEMFSSGPRSWRIKTDLPDQLKTG